MIRKNLTFNLLLIWCLNAGQPICIWGVPRYSKNVLFLNTFKPHSVHRIEIEIKKFTEKNQLFFKVAHLFTNWCCNPRVTGIFFRRCCDGAAAELERFAGEKNIIDGKSKFLYNTNVWRTFWHCVCSASEPLFHN